MPGTNLGGALDGQSTGVRTPGSRDRIFFLPGDWGITLQGLKHHGLMRGPVLRPQSEENLSLVKRSPAESCKLELSIAAIKT